jgi:hypothetical protein
MLGLFCAVPSGGKVKSVMNIFQPGENSLTSERRIHWRQRVLLSCVELGQNNRGVLHNISEDGAALQAAEELDDDELTMLRFQLSQSPSWLEAKGRITWKSASKRTAGVQFVDLSDEAREQIRTWISDFGPQRSKRASSKAIAIAMPVPLDTVDSVEKTTPDNSVTAPVSVSHASTTSPHVLSLQGTGYGQELSDGEHESTSYRIFLLLASFLVVALLLLAVVNRVRLKQKANIGEAAAGAAQLADSSVSSVAVNHASDSELALNRSHFALQVGAMSRQENALALADELQHRKFPALIFRAKDDRFFRVFVGPYDDADSAARLSHELKSQGFASIRTEWPFIDK